MREIKYTCKGTWKIDILKEILIALKKEDDGSVREVPIKYLWETARVNPDKIIKWVGWYCKRALLEVSKLINIDIKVNELNCKKYELEGSIEVRFI